MVPENISEQLEHNAIELTRADDEIYALKCILDEQIARIQEAATPSTSAAFTEDHEEDEVCLKSYKNTV